MQVDNTTHFPVPLHFSNSSSCFKLRANIYVLSAVILSHLFLLPLFIWILYLGYQRQRRPCSTSTDTTSPSDLFTYHFIIMQLSEFIGFIVASLAYYYDLVTLKTVGTGILNITFLGKALFHLLTCVERYLAVVHPITYLQLKQAKGVRITNIGIGCVWVLGFLTLIVVFGGSYKFAFILYTCFTASLSVGIVFCSISILCALKRPGPGETGGNRERVDQSKQRAFYTIMVILGLQVLRFGGGLIVNAWIDSSIRDACLRFMTVVWFDLPSVLVLPLLFLHRAGKLRCFKL